MQEGVAMEAVAFEGHQKLDNLILIYDANDVTLDAMAAKGALSADLNGLRTDLAARVVPAAPPAIASAQGANA